MTTTEPQFTDKQIAAFIEDGYLHLPGAFAAETAAAICDRIWQRLASVHAVNVTAPQTWTKPVVHLQETLTGQPFTDVWTPRLRAGANQLIGHRSATFSDSLGWWPVSFPGFDSPPWQPPETGWHVDGQQFHHHPTSPDQALLTLLIHTRIEPGDGGTAIVPGSHKVVAHILANAEPEGLDVHELARRAVAAVPRDRVVEAIGQPGDAYLMHPFMLHARSVNTGSRVRVICNPCIVLHHPMVLDPDAPGERTPVERATMLALAEPMPASLC
ncbi:MAG: phytanoyl-CoA dioxygenase family protein [Verrucomicrobia bacterium]|nr:phytanoyl-CoA dioxygenase family protein [Verrucomicrobiota bacterium]